MTARLGPWLLFWSILFAAINWQPLAGRAAPIWDAKASFFPFFVLVADHVRAGRLVTWDLWSNGGLPRSGDPEFGAFAPLQLLAGLAFGGTTTGFIAYWMLIWWLGGAGVFLLGRHFGVAPWGAFVVAAGFSLSGVYVGHAEHVSWLVAFSAVPFVLWRLDVAITRRHRMAAIQSGALWGMAAMSGYPGLTVVTALFMAAWALCRVVGGSSDSPVGAGPKNVGWIATARTSAVSLALAAIVGLICLSPTFVSFFYEGAGVHSRTGLLPRDVAVRNNPLDTGALVTAVSPYFATLKYHRIQTLWPRTDVSSCSIFAGALLFTFAVIGLVSRPPSRFRWALATLGAVMLGTALGDSLPLRGWLYDWIYPTRFFRHPAMFRLYYIFTLSVLALLGIKEMAAALEGASKRRRIGGAVAFAIAMGALVVWYEALPLDAARAPDAALGRVHMFVIWGAVAALGLLMSSARFAAAVPAIAISIATADAALTAALGRHTLFSTRPADVAWWARQQSVHASSVDITRRGLTRTLAACESNPPCTEPNTWGMITKVPALDTYTPATNEFFDTIKAHPVIAGAAIGSRRVWFSTSAAVADPTLTAFRAFVQRSSDLRGLPIVVHEPAAMLGGSADSPDHAMNIGQLPAAEEVTTRLRRYQPDELALDVLAPADGWLLVTERWARGWSASVDERRTPVYGGAFAFRAIRVPQGLHRVRFTYDAIAIPWLLAVSWTTLVVVLVLSVRAEGDRSSRMPT